MMVSSLHRPRRLRRFDWQRRLVRETCLSVDDLVWPVFVMDGTGQRQPVGAMPGVERFSIDVLVEAVAHARMLGIPAVALFPFIAPSARDVQAREAVREDNLLCRAVRAVRAAVPDIGIITDVALDPYTSHGHDGLMRDGAILNDETVEVLCRQAVVQAQAGADILAPSDMMDGRVGAIRRALDASGHQDVAILSYAAKYASAFYGPFREAVGTGQILQGDKCTYQMDCANAEEALREVALDLSEGADMIMIKPGLPYLDILWRVRERFQVPVFGYQVSGEYAMIRAAAQNGWINEERAMHESLLAFKRAGACGIFSYFAPVIADRLRRASL